MGQKDPGTILLASAENLHSVVAQLRPDLVLMSRRDLDEAIAILIEARQHGGRRGKGRGGYVVPVEKDPG